MYLLGLILVSTFLNVLSFHSGRRFLGNDASKVLQKRTQINDLMKMKFDHLPLSMSPSDDMDDSTQESVPPKKRGRKSKADKEAEIANAIANGAEVDASNVPVVKKRKGRPKKSATDTAASYSKTQGKAKGKKSKKSSVEDDLQTMFPNLDKDLEELEGKLGSMGDLPSKNEIENLGISEEDRLALESISEKDLKEALDAFKPGEKDEMEEFISLMESAEGKQVANAVGMGDDTTTSTADGADVLLDLLAEKEKASLKEIGADDNDNNLMNADTENIPLTIESSSGTTVVPEVVGSVSTSIDATTTDGTSTTASDKKEDAPLVIDGVELDSKEFDLGVEPPPLEEFKRLMESLGPDTLFEDEGLMGSEEGEMIRGKEISDLSPEELESLKAEIQIELDLPDPPSTLTSLEKGWYPKTYTGGKPEREPALPVGPGDNKLYSKSIGLAKKDSQPKETYMKSIDDPAQWRLQIVSVVTNSSANSTSIDVVNQIYDYIRKETDNDERINFQTISYSFADDLPFEELEDNIQMWIESYNTYHLVDGAAMKEVWGAIMPHIVLSDHNLEAIVKQIKWALAEDSMGGALLSPRFRRVRFRGGAAEMVTGFNTENMQQEFSVISVR